MLEYLFGFSEIFVSAEGAAQVMECCRVLGATPRRQRYGEGGLFLRLSLRDAKRILPLLAEDGVSCTVIASGGAPVAFLSALRRPFLVAGLLLAVAILSLSGLFLWDVRVEGLAEIPESEIREMLALQGVACGSFIPRLDTDATALALREGDARIAYVSVNRQGTVLTVSVREAVTPPPGLPTAPANLVAARDGVITLPLIYEGRVLVAAGDTVRAGDLLATGVLETDNNGMRLTRAAGAVMARTQETLTVHVPFSYTVGVPTGRVRYALFLHFFERERKVFKNSGNLTGNCDIIEKIQTIRAWNGRTLPLGWRLVTYREMTEVSQSRTAREALALAEDALAAELAAATATRSLLSRTVETVVSDEGITLVCTAVFEEDIARVAEFEIDG